MNINKYFKTNFSIILAVLCMVVSIAAAEDMVKGQYSGWGLGEAFSDLARKGKLNIVGDFGQTKITAFNLVDDVYIEEALNLLAISNGLTVRKNGELWLILPKKLVEDQKQEFCIMPAFTYCKTEEIKEVFDKLTDPGVNYFFPPKINAVVLVGKKLLLDEMKKLIATLDTPDWTLRTEYILCDENENTVASCSFLNVNKKPFRLIYEGKSGEGFEINAVARANYDGAITFAEKIKLKHQEKIFTRETSTISSNLETVVSQLQINAKTFVLKRKIALLNFSGSISSKTSRNLRLEGAVQKALTEPEDPVKSFERAGYTVVSGPQSALLDKPVLLENVPLVATVEKIADEEKLSLIFDEHVSGNVSAYCYARRLDKEDLIRSMLQVKGYAAVKNSDGYTVTTHEKSRNLTQISENVYLSPPLQRITTAQARRVLSEWLSSMGVNAKIMPLTGARLKVEADEPWRSTLAMILDEWSNLGPTFAINFQAEIGSQKFTATATLADLVPVRRHWHKDSVDIHTRFKENASSFDAGLKEINFSINATETGKGRWMLQSAMTIPETWPMEIFTGNGDCNAELKLFK